MSETGIENIDRIYVIYDRSESVMESIAKDAVTIGFLAFCIWLSKGSTFWTLICGCLFFLAIASKLYLSNGDRKVVLKGTKAAKSWAERLQ